MGSQDDRQNHIDCRYNERAIMRELFCYLRTHRAVALLLTVLYVGLTILPHDQVNNVFLSVRESLTPVVYDRVMILVAAAAFLSASVWLLTCLRKGPAPGLKTLYWLSSIALAAAAFPLLVAVNSEAVHFLQYAILVLPVLAMTGTFTEAVGWAALVGIADEAFQYGVLHADWGVYFDFNDVVFNVMGAGLGAVGLAISCQAERVSRPETGRWALSHVLLGLLLGTVLVLGTMNLLGVYPPESGDRPWLLLSRSAPAAEFWTKAGDWGGTFHVLTPYEGLVALFLLLLFYGRLDSYLSITCDRPGVR